MQAEFRRLANSDRESRYCSVEDIDVADLILMTDIGVIDYDYWNYVRSVHEHPLVRASESRLFLYSELDSPYCLYQGLYCSMPSTLFNWDRQRSVAYYKIRNELVLAARDRAREIQPKWLYSFVGARNNRVRDMILQLQSLRGHLIDTSHFCIYEDKSENRDKKQYFVDSILNSKFVLCPRGLGLGSIRLFETMALGRVPVIISDRYVLPQGPDWSTCSIRIREHDIQLLPDILSRIEPQWQQLANKAFVAFDEWFASDIIIHRFVEQCQAIAKNKRIPEWIWSRVPDPQHMVMRCKNRCNAIKQRFKSLASPKS